MKRLLSLCLAECSKDRLLKAMLLPCIIVALTLVGCGGGDGDSSTTSTNNITETTDNTTEETRTLTIYDRETLQPISDVNLLAYYDRETLQPISDVNLLAYSVDDALSVSYGQAGYEDREHVEFQLVSDANGQIDITDLEGNAYLLKAYKDGYLPIHVRSVWIFPYGPQLALYMDAIPDEIAADNTYYDIDSGMSSSSSSIGNYTEREDLLDDFHNLILQEEKLDENWTDNSFSDESSDDVVEIESGNLLSTDLRDVLKIRQDQMVEEIDSYSEDGTDLVIYKDYNDGVILQEGSTTIAIDLMQNTTHTIEPSLITKIDAFFTTHEHWDHFDGYVAKLAAENDSPYYVPTYMLTGFDENEWDFHNRTMLTDATGLDAGETVTINSWTIEAIETTHNGLTSHLSYLITTPQGRKILHVGDTDDFITISDYFYEDGSLPSRMSGIDYLLLPVWWSTEQLETFVDTFSPEVLIPMHANEAGHSSDQRYSYDNIAAMGTTYLNKVQVLFYGESANSSELSSD